MDQLKSISPHIKTLSQVTTHPRKWNEGLAATTKNFLLPASNASSKFSFFVGLTSEEIRVNAGALDDEE